MALGLATGRLVTAVAELLLASACPSSVAGGSESRLLLIVEPFELLEPESRKREGLGM